MSNKSISIVIVTYNSEKDIYDCLASIFAYNDIGKELEIIIVDNCSCNYPAMKDEIYRRYGEDIIVISNTKNGGYGQGNNVGIKIASAPIIAIMNPDVRLIMPIFKSVVQQFRNPKVVMCAGKQMFSEERPAISFSSSFLLPPITQFFLNRIGYKHDLYIPRLMWLQGAFFFIRKETFNAIGLFDENIFMYGEEFDIHTRIYKLFPRAKSVYIKDMQYLHLAGNRTFSEKNYKRNLFSLMYVANKFGIKQKSFLLRYQIGVIIANIAESIAAFIHRRPSENNLSQSFKIINEIKITIRS